MVGSLQRHLFPNINSKNKLTRNFLLALKMEKKMLLLGSFFSHSQTEKTNGFIAELHFVFSKLSKRKKKKEKRCSFRFSIQVVACTTVLNLDLSRQGWSTAKQ